MWLVYQVALFLVRRQFKIAGWGINSAPKLATIIAVNRGANLLTIKGIKQEARLLEAYTKEYED